MWDLIVSVPERCLSFYFVLTELYLFTCKLIQVLRFPMYCGNVHNRLVE